MRLAQLALVAVCILLIGATGAGAVAGPSGSGSAGIAQYPVNTPQTLAGPEAPGTLEAPEESGTLPEPEQQDVAGDTGVPSEEQVDAGGLPFTGLALIAMLLAGTALLGAGLALRRGARATAS